MTEKRNGIPLEAWRESLARAIGCEVSDIKTVKELLTCDPIGACEAHGRCWTHSEWQLCGSPLRTKSGDLCENVADGSDGLCWCCREFKTLREQRDNTPEGSSGI
jgi:hypothetical protein